MCISYIYIYIYTFRFTTSRPPARPGSRARPARCGGFATRAESSFRGAGFPGAREKPSNSSTRGFLLREFSLHDSGVPVSQVC